MVGVWGGRGGISCQEYLETVLSPSSLQSSALQTGLDLCLSPAGSLYSVALETAQSSTATYNIKGNSMGKSWKDKWGAYYFDRAFSYKACIDLTSNILCLAALLIFPIPHLNFKRGKMTISVNIVVPCGTKLSFTSINVGNYNYNVQTSHQRFMGEYENWFSLPLESRPQISCH